MSTSQTPRRRPRADVTVKPFHWFKGESVRALYDAIGRAGPDSARLEVRQDGEHMTFRVIADGEGNEVSAAEDDSTEINNSFLCPPRCP